MEAKEEASFWLPPSGGVTLPCFVYNLQASGPPVPWERLAGSEASAEQCRADFGCPPRSKSCSSGAHGALTSTLVQLPLATAAQRSALSGQHIPQGVPWCSGRGDGRSQGWGSSQRAGIPEGTGSSPSAWLENCVLNNRILCFKESFWQIQVKLGGSGNLTFPVPPPAPGTYRGTQGPGNMGLLGLEQWGLPLVCLQMVCLQMVSLQMTLVGHESGSSQAVPLRTPSLSSGSLCPGCPGMQADHVTHPSGLCPCLECTLWGFTELHGVAYLQVLRKDT